MPFTIQGNTIYSSGGAIVVQLNPSSTDLVIDENGGCIGSNMNEGQVCLVINNICSPCTGGGGGTWGGITGTLSDQTDLQTALDGKSDTGHTHALSDITQSGATTNQVPKWNGSAWVPANDAGGGASVTEITYADIQTAITNGTLTPGAWYLITDAAGTDLGFLTNAINENTINVSGVGGYLNADFQAVGDYSGTPETFGTQLGIWRTGFEQITINYLNLTGGTFAAGDTITGGTTGATAVIVTDDGAASMTAYMTSPGVAFDGSEALDNGAGVTADMDGAATSPTIVQGDVVIWNLLHYQLTDATLLDGTDPATNTAAYTALAKGDYPETYVTAWDVSEFDFPNNWIQYREDLSGNKLYYSKNNDLNNLGLGSTAISLFQWGRTTWTGNISEEGVFNEQNFLGTIANITLGFNAIIQNNTCANTTPVIESSSLGSFCEITGNIFGNNSYLFNCILEKSSLITNNQILSGTNIAQTQFFVAVLENCIFNNCVFRYNALGANAIISEINAASGTDIENNILENGGSLTGITAEANCAISRNKIGQGATLGGSTTMGDGAAITDNTLANGYSLTALTLAAGETIDGLNYGQLTAIDEATRDALIAPAAGLLILNTDTSKLNFYTGAGWEAITSA